MTTYYDTNGKEHTANGTDDKGRPVYRAHRPCLRCGGQGGAEQWKHTGWTCYRCGGAGHDPAGPFTNKLYTADAYAKLEATRAKRAATKARKDAEKAAAVAAELADNWDAWYTPRFTVVDNILANRNVAGDFVRSVARDIEAHKRPADHVIDMVVGAILRKLAEADIKAASRHIGVAGERAVFTLHVEHVIDVSFGSFPRIYRYINLMRDEDGNRVVYIGNSMCKGDTVRGKWTVKEHGERDGELQTVVCRPTKVEVLSSTDER
jgi:hypothetical protein